MGIVEVTAASKAGKEKIRDAFDFLFGIIRESFVFAVIDASLYCKQ